MKKLLALMLLTGTLAVTSCGPSAEEQRKKHMADSADSVRRHDSTEKALMNDVNGLINAPVDTSKNKDTAKH